MSIEHLWSTSKSKIKLYFWVTRWLKVLTANEKLVASSVQTTIPKLEKEQGNDISNDKGIFSQSVLLESHQIKSAKGKLCIEPLCTHSPPLHHCVDFLRAPSGSEGKESAFKDWDLGSIPGLGRSPGEGNGNPLQYSCLEDSMDRGAWRAVVHGVAKSRTWLSN